jgi:catecholate siderophore receptor
MAFISGEQHRQQHRTVLRRALVSSIASLAVSTGSALAQSPETGPAGGEAGPILLPPLSVEGAAAGGPYNPGQLSLPKLTEPLLDVPQSVTVIPRQLIEDQANISLRETLRNVPGISIAAGEGGAQGDNLTIRGFSARSDLYLDGMRDFGSYSRDPFYLQSIEVLKGPASILFGRGSTGGVVEQNSKMPKLDAFGEGDLTYGTDLTKRLTVDVNQPLPDLAQGAALRINLMGNDGNVAGRDIARNSRFGFAPSLALGLGTPTRLNFNYLHLSEYDISDYGLPWINQAAAGTVSAIARPAPLSLTRENYYGFRQGNYFRANVDVATARVEHDINNAITISDQLRYARYGRQFRTTEPQLYTTASATGRGTTGTAALIAPGTPLSSLLVSRNQIAGDSVETYLVNQLDTTLRFGTGFLSHTLRAGIEASRETSEPVRYSTIGPYSRTPLLWPNPSDPYNAITYLSSVTDTKALTQAIYALDTIKLDEQWELIGGLRFDRFEASSPQATLPNPVTRAGASISSVSQIDTMLSWRAAIVYKPLPYASAYFAAGTSFNPSAEALSLSLANQGLPPEKSRSYEIGNKWDVLDGKLSLTGALFYIQKDNLREPDPNNPQFNILAGSGIAEGGEITVAGNLTPEWQVFGGYGYTYTVITKTTRTGPTSDLGRRFANAPLHTANLWTTYTLPWQKLQIGGGFNIVSSRFAASVPTSVGGVAFLREVPGYVVASVMAKYPLSGNVDLQLNISNLTNVAYYDQLHPSHVVPGAGRTALLTLTYKY